MFNDLYYKDNYAGTYCLGYLSEFAYAYFNQSIVLENIAGSLSILNNQKNWFIFFFFLFLGIFASKSSSNLTLDGVLIRVYFF